MTDDEFNECLDDHFADEKEVSGVIDHHQQTLSDRLAANDEARRAFVSRARLEQSLREALNPKRPPSAERLIEQAIHPRSRRWVGWAALTGLGLAVMLLAASLWHGGDPASPNPDEVIKMTGMRGAEAESWTSVLPKPSAGRGASGAPPGWIRRLESYVPAAPRMTEN